MSGLVKCDCGDVFRWAETVNGERIPVNPTPDPAGNLKVTRRGDDQLPLARVLPANRRFGVTLYTSHFATCTDAEKHRRRRPQPKGPRGMWLAANAPTDQPYPCRCGREGIGCRTGANPHHCPCRGRTDLDHLPTTCCAKAALSTKEN
jgi:hypothetical protein